MVAYVKPTPQRLVRTSLGEEQATELWISSADRSHERKLVEGAHSDSAALSLADFSSPAFSPDGKRIYFLSSAWVTSKAVHEVDVETGRERYVTAGNTLEVIPRGEFAGCLLVAQHRYRQGENGSYDWIWVLGPDGSEVARAADDSDDSARQLADWTRANIPPNGRGAVHAQPNPHCIDR